MSSSPSWRSALYPESPTLIHSTALWADSHPFTPGPKLPLVFALTEIIVYVTNFNNRIQANLTALNFTNSYNVYIIVLLYGAVDDLYQIACVFKIGINFFFPRIRLSTALLQHYYITT